MLNDDVPWAGGRCWGLDVGGARVGGIQAVTSGMVFEGQRLGMILGDSVWEQSLG